mgnify:CR=1 FL=1
MTDDLDYNIFKAIEQDKKLTEIFMKIFIDNLYLNKYNNGLTTLLKHTRFAHPEVKMFAIELEKAVRGKFAEFTERIFEKRSR